MVVNSNTNVYGINLTKSESYNTKAKGSKIIGFKFPFGKIGDNNFLNKSSDLDVIKANLRQLLMTHRGERVMLPNFGTNLKNYLMEPLDQILLSQIRKEISESIYNYADNVELTKIQIFPIDSVNFDNSHGLRIVVFCALKENENINFEVKVEIS
jgi:phage baseplate assembly protein W